MLEDGIICQRMESFAGGWNHLLLPLLFVTTHLLLPLLFDVTHLLFPLLFIVTHLLLLFFSL